MITPPNHPHEMLLKVYTTCTCASQLGITLCMTVYCLSSNVRTYYRFLYMWVSICIKFYTYRYVLTEIHAIMPHETLLKIHALLVQTCDIIVHSAPEISLINQ